MRRFLAVAVRPWPGSGVVLNIVTIAVPTGPSVAIGLLVSPWGWTGLFAVFFAFSVLAGVRLQHKQDERLEAHFWIEAFPEPIGDTVERTGQRYAGRTILWMAVENAGPQATFSARFWNVRAQTWGVRDPGSVDDRYSHGIAWEDVSARECEIGHRGRGRLMVAWMFRDPFVFWFMTPASAAFGQGEAHQPGIVLSHDRNAVEFDVLVVNEAEQVSVEKHAIVRLADDGSVAAFALSDPYVI